jgi:predicted transcriptional regulator
MMRKDNNGIPPDLLEQLRRLIPKRPLTYAESLTVARVQAARLRKLLTVTTAAMPLRWLVGGLHDVEVQTVPAHTLEEGMSGLTARKNKRYLIRVNRNNSHAHRRFTLAHELYHVITYPYISLIYANLGHGNPERREAQVETIANYFAAYLLMPAALVKRAWLGGIRDVSALAGLFEVSVTAMRIRLESLGYIDEVRPTGTYFRRTRLRMGAHEMARL